MKLLRILMVEDVESDAEITFRELRRSGLQFEYRRVETEADLTRECNDMGADISCTPSRTHGCQSRTITLL